MGSLDINKAESSDLTNAVTNWDITQKSTDGIGRNDETEWVNSEFSTYWGAFNEIPELKSAILTKAIWIVGKGWEADAETKVILDHISGWGKDTFDDVIYNMEVMKRVAGDAFAEIIRDEKTGILINLKPLDPASIKIIVDRKGIIKRYEQFNKTSKEKETIHNFEPKDIFHLSNNRLADNIHGLSDIETVKSIIKASMESFTDNKWLMHHQARPLIVFKLGTDDETKRDAFIAKMDAAVAKGENIYVPYDDNTFSFEVVQINPSNFILQWQDELKNKFYRAIGVPQIVFGSAGTTESGSKIEYAVHETTFEKDQRFLEQQIWNQLFLRVNFIPPASIMDNLQTDESKDANQGLNFKPNDMTAGNGK